jgi:hypothetical protein
MLATDPLSIKRPVKYLPVIVTPRLAAQEGLFTLQPKLEVPLEEQLPPGLDGLAPQVAWQHTVSPETSLKQ